MVEDTKLDQPAEIKTDQAEGLRSMFGDRAPRVVCMSCALDADTASTMTLGTAHALRQQGQRVLLVDEIPCKSGEIFMGWPIPCAMTSPRYWKTIFR